MGFFYISAPFLEKSKDATIRQIRQVVLRKNLADGRQITMDRAKFKLANLDTLMSSNDKILKLQNGIESFLKKVDKQYLDLQQKISNEWFVKGTEKQMPVPKYLFDFKWNDSKYPRSYPIPRIVETFQVKLNNIENQFRSKLNIYNDTKLQLSQNSQKQGNYYAKDLTDLLVEPIVNPNDFIYTKFVTTLILIIPSSNIQEFLSTYQLWTDNVIPYSAKKLNIPQKDGLTIWKVNIFTAQIKQLQQNFSDSDHHSDDEDQKKNKKKEVKKQKKVLTPIQQFNEKAREKLKIVVKQFKFQSGLSDTRRKKRQGLQAKLKQQTKSVSQLCLTYFSQMYEMYVHSKLLRLIIETNMRFGSDKTVVYVIQAVAGKQKNVQTLLVDIFGDKENQGLYGTKDEIDDGQDFFPYIYVPVLSL